MLALRELPSFLKGEIKGEILKVAKNLSKAAIAVEQLRE